MRLGAPAFSEDAPPAQEPDAAAAGARTVVDAKGKIAGEFAGPGELLRKVDGAFVAFGVDRSGIKGHFWGTSGFCFTSEDCGGAPLVDASGVPCLSVQDWSGGPIYYPGKPFGSRTVRSLRRINATFCDSLKPCSLYTGVAKSLDPKSFGLTPPFALE